jgi:hypothetical protein
MRAKLELDYRLPTGTPRLMLYRESLDLLTCFDHSAVAAFKNHRPYNHLQKSPRPFRNLVTTTSIRGVPAHHPTRNQITIGHATTTCPKLITCKSLPGPSPKAQNTTLGAGWGGGTPSRPPSYKTRRRPAANEHTHTHKNAGHPTVYSECVCARGTLSFV